MKKSDYREGGIADRDGDVIDLGAASEETKGIPDPLTVESFQSRPPADELSAD